MSYKEFLYWQAYNKINPLPPYRNDALTALVSSLMANIFSSSKTKFTPSDFMPEFKPQKTSQESVSDKLDKLLALL